MKKLKIDNLSPTPLLIIMAVCVFVTVPVRIFQFTNCLDSETGFWETIDMTAYLLYIICAAFALVSLFISAFSGAMTRPSFKEERDIPLGICTSLFAAGLLYESIINITSLITLLSEFTASETNVYTFLTTSGALAIGLEGLFGFLGTIYLIFVAISAFAGNDTYGSKRLLGLSPVLWAMFRLIYHFIDPINYRNVSQLFLELIMLMFAMLFFMSFARIASGVNEEKSMWLLWFSGTCAALLAYICALAPFILVVTGRGDLIPAKYPIHYCDLGLALFLTSFLFTVTPLTNDVGD